MVACGLMAVLLDVLPPQMLVPITPEWLGWCDEKPLTPAPNIVNVTDYEVNQTSFASTDVATTTPSSETTWAGEETSSSNLSNATTATQTEITKEALIDKSTCTKKDFDPRISLVYLAAGPVEVLSSPLVAFLCDRIGSNALLMFGLISTAFIDIPFAYGSGFVAYLLVRIFMNLATTITEVSYLHMIGQLFAGDDVMRARFLGLYSTVLGFDYFGPTLCGLLYHLSGQAVPFLTLLVIGFITALVFFTLGLNCKITKNTYVQENIEEIKSDIPYLTLVKDPYIIVIFIAVFLVILPKAMIAPFISIWLMDKYDTSAWITGMVYFPGFIAYVLSNIIAERLLSKFKEYIWAIGAVSLAIDGISVIALPYSPDIKCFSAIFALQVATAAISGFTIFPMFLKIADKRYGCPKSSSVHGFSFMAVGLAYFIGPMLASGLFVPIGFRYINLVVGCLHIFIAPFIAMLKKITDEKKEITEETYLVTSRESLHDPDYYE